MKTYSEFCAVLAKQLFELIDQNGSLLAWHEKWDSTGSARLPIGSSGGMYHGANLLLLFHIQHRQGFKSNQWLTFNQVKQRGGCVKKGTKGNTVYFWKLLEKISADDPEASKILPLFKTYCVFNLDQTTLSDDSESVAPLFSSSDVDSLVQRLGVTISHFGGRSYYNPMDDVIVLPEQKYFTSEKHYYAVLLHELIHWTGGFERLPRDCFDNYGKSDKDRAQEELIAEVGSLFLASHFGLQAGLEHHASYVQSWKTLLSDKEIVTAVAKATKAFEWIVENAQVVSSEKMALA